MVLTARLGHDARPLHFAILRRLDCMSYAVASLAGMPLLFTGEDLGRTDIRPA